MTDELAAEEIVLSEERRAILAPQLRRLLEDLRRLAELESPELEPAMKPFVENEEHRDSR